MSDHIPAGLLLALLRKRWDEAERLLDRVGGAELVEQCRQSDVHPWVHSLLVAHDRLGLIDAQARRELGRMREKVRKDNALLLARAEQAVDLLQAAGVTPVALKGLDLLHRVYASFDERTVDDVDLLVRPAQLPAALDALEAAGWRAPPEPERTHYIRSSHHLPLVSPGTVTVNFELHWNLAQAERLGVDDEALVARALPLEVAGRRLLRLEDHDLVAHLLIHHFSHYFDRRLKWLVDLEKLLARPGFRWEVVVERIREWGAVTTAGASLLHLRKLRPDLFPDQLLRELPVAAWRRALAWPLRSSHPLELYRNTQRRRTQLYLAAIMHERPARLPAWILHRMRRDRRPGDNPLDRRTAGPGAGVSPR